MLIVVEFTHPIVHLLGLLSPNKLINSQNCLLWRRKNTRVEERMEEWLLE